MERIKIFIQKLQEVYYSKHPKSAIDIDLMLDYTRIMYVDLLEWRKEFTDPIHSDIVSLMQEHTSATAKETPVEKPAEPTAATATQPSTNTAQPSNTIKEETVVQHATPVVQTPQASEPVAPPQEETQAEENQFHQPEEVLPEAPKEVTPDVVAAFPEEESIAIINKEHTGISFEPPVHKEKPVLATEAIIEEAPTETHFIEEIAAPTPEEIPVPDIKANVAAVNARLFDAIVETKDIRASIGINDKYLFLNELFNNHKSDYEETLDKINRFSNSKDAAEWVKSKTAVTQKWDNADPTVQSFYALLDKHFNIK